jgi:CHAT domain-containing protein/tetratricopeptide (TPR) repeat protein
MAGFCLRIILLCALILLPALEAHARISHPSAHRPEDRIALMRSTGDYREALRAAIQHKRSLDRDPGARPWQREDAARLVATLERAATLTDLDRAVLAGADRADETIRQSIIDGRYLDGTRTAGNQLAVRRRILGYEHQETAKSLKWLADLAMYKGEYTLLPDMHGEVLAMRRKILGEGHPEVAESLMDLGFSFKNRRSRSSNDLAEAARCYQEALSLRRQLLDPDDPAIATSMFYIADLKRVNSDYSGAEAGLREVLALQEKVLNADHPDIAATVSLLAYVLMIEDRLVEALTYARRSTALSRTAQGVKKVDLAFAISMEAGCCEYLGNYADAERLYTELVRILEFLRIQGRDDPLKSNHPLTDYLMRARAQVELGKGSEAWMSVERAINRRVLDALLPPDTTMSLVSVSSGDVPDGRFLPLERIQRAIPDETALVGWIDTGRGNGKPEYPTWAYVIRKGGAVRWVRIEGAAAPKVASLPYDLRMEIVDASLWPLRVTDIGPVMKMAREVHDERFAPLEEQLHGIMRLIVVQSSPLMGLIPIEALVDSSGEAVADRYEVFYVPSATIFAWMRERGHGMLDGRYLGNRDPKTWRTLLIGDPGTGRAELGSPSSRNSLPSTEASGERFDAVLMRSILNGDRDALASLPQLLLSRKEVEQAAALFHSPTVLLGPDATVRRLRSLVVSGDMAEYDLIHLATHALEPDGAMTGAIVLGRSNGQTGTDDGESPLLVTREIGTWRLGADLVSLSACHTAGTWGGTDSPLGLGKYFLMAGARSVLASLWKVDDTATSVLFGRFYENLTGSYRDQRLGGTGRPIPMAAALREAKTWLRTMENPDGSRPFQHPAYWAGFILMGDPLD